MVSVKPGGIIFFYETDVYGELHDSYAIFY